MDRDEAIRDIESLFPVDSEYPETNRIGRMLLDQAKADVYDWRNEPTEVLVRYAELCRRQDNLITAEYERNAINKL